MLLTVLLCGYDQSQMLGETVRNDLCVKVSVELVSLVGAGSYLYPSPASPGL